MYKRRISLSSTGRELSAILRIVGPWFFSDNRTNSFSTVGDMRCSSPYPPRKGVNCSGKTPNTAANALSDMLVLLGYREVYFFNVSIITV